VIVRGQRERTPNGKALTGNTVFGKIEKAKDQRENKTKQPNGVIIRTALINVVIIINAPLQIIFKEYGYFLYQRNGTSALLKLFTDMQNNYQDH